ncbi:MAG: VCBS repeat-containing protein [Acidobacteria bacterium]|nr:VCBS repeat-containing protein [Acidobacteriota bacterium]
MTSSVRAALFLAVAGAVAEDRPGVFFREDWTAKPPFEQVTQDHVASPDLLQILYGPARDSIKKRHHGSDHDPYYIFSGACEGHWAVALRRRDALADLTGNAKIRWRARNSGFRRLHVIVKLADGTWLVSDESDGASKDWRVQEFKAADLHWRKLNIDTITEGAEVERPDLSHVDEIGFTDLMKGASSPACSRLDWIEVLAKPVKRERAAVQPSRWVRHLISEGFQTQSSAAADFTGDGRIDVITGDIGNDRRIYLYSGPNWQPTLLRSGIRLIQSAALDVDGDGDTDFIGAQYRPGLVFWLERPKDPLHDPWPYHVIDGLSNGGVNGVHGLTLGDVDRDGRLDLIAGSGWPEGKLPNSLVWFRIPKDPRQPWERHVFADRDAPGLSHYLGFGDVNGDGRADVATGAKIPPEGNWFAWWEQPAIPGRTWTKHVIAENQPGATNILMADMNGDGKTDFIATRGHGQGVVWYEAPEWKRHDIDMDIVGPHSLAAADIDGDGDIDAITCAKDSRVVVWYENDGRGKFTTHLIDNDQAAYEVRLVDIDGDGDLDLLIAGQETRNVVWYENRLRQTTGGAKK